MEVQMRYVQTAIQNKTIKTCIKTLINIPDFEEVKYDSIKFDLNLNQISFLHIYQVAGGNVTMIKTVN